MGLEARGFGPPALLEGGRCPGAAAHNGLNLIAGGKQVGAQRVENGQASANRRLIAKHRAGLLHGRDACLPARQVAGARLLVGRDDVHALGEPFGIVIRHLVARSRVDDDRRPRRLQEVGHFEKVAHLARIRVLHCRGHAVEGAALLVIANHPRLTLTVLHARLADGRHTEVKPLLLERRTELLNLLQKRTADKASANNANAHLLWCDAHAGGA